MQAGPTMYEIRDSGTTIGHIWKHPDGWRAKIGVHEAISATSPEDAAIEAYAKVTGQSIGDIPKNNPDFLEMKESKKIYRLLAWLADNAVRHNGALRYSHTDLASVLSPKQPDTMSR